MRGSSGKQHAAFLDLVMLSSATVMQHSKGDALKSGQVESNCVRLKCELEKVRHVLGTIPIEGFPRSPVSSVYDVLHRIFVEKRQGQRR